MAKESAKNEFFSDVYDVVRLIPNGRVTSYGAIAAYLGSKQGARMVGWAVNNCDSSLPAHRVVNRNGMLSGKHFFKGASMQELLEAEGIVVLNDQVQNLEKYFWSPEKEL